MITLKEFIDDLKENNEQITRIIKDDLGIFRVEHKSNYKGDGLNNQQMKGGIA